MSYSSALLYFPRDKSFLIYPIQDCNISQEQWSTIESGGKVIVSCTYDGIDEKAVVIQVARTEDDLAATLIFSKNLKKMKNVPIETVLSNVERVRKSGRQRFGRIQVSSS
jgi:hypothetical protein